MRQARGAGGRLRGRAPAMLLVAIGLLLAALVVHHATIAWLTGRNPALALRLAPQDAEALTLRATQLADAGPANLDAAEAMARAALRGSPLLSRPFVVAAIAEERKGNRALAVTLMQTAASRDPRSLPAHYWLFEKHVLARDYPSAISEIDTIMRLRPVESGGLVGALVPLTLDPAGRTALVDALAANPSWQGPFLAIAARQAPDPKAFYTMLFRLIQTPGAAIPDDFLAQMLGGIAGRGDYGIAHAIFHRFAEDDRDGANLVYDGAFDGRRGAAPFNWTLYSRSSGVAQIDRDARGGTALLARHYGGEPAVLATQTLVLVPGAYVLSARVRAEDVPLDPSLLWELVCLPSQTLLARLVNPKGRTDTVSLWQGFQVPADCRAQQLTLRFLPENTGAVGAARYLAVAVQPIGQESDTP